MHFCMTRNTGLLSRAVLGLVALAMVLSACSQSEGGSDASAGNEYTIGMIQFSGTDQTSQLLLRGYEAKARELGYKVTSIDPQGSADKAVAAMQTLVQKGVDMIVVTVFPSTQLTAGLMAAKNAKVPVISLGGGPAVGVQAAWTSDKIAGESIGEKLMADTGGNGSLLVLSYTASTPCVDRQDALTEAIKGTELASSVKREEVPVPGQVAAGTQFAHAFLAKNQASSNELVIWACWDDPALGAVTAVKQAHRTGIRIYAINGQAGAVKAVQDGEMTATYWIDVETGGQKVAEETEKYIEAGVDAKPEEVAVPGVLVTADNVEQFIKEHPNVLTVK